MLWVNAYFLLSLVSATAALLAAGLHPGETHHLNGFCERIGVLGSASLFGISGLRSFLEGFLDDALIAKEGPYGGGKLYPAAGVLLVLGGEEVDDLLLFVELLLKGRHELYFKF
jgi:hypothetical protein